eukprot:Em0019g727a
MHSYSVLTGLSDFTEPAGSVQVYCATLIAQLLPLMAPSWSNGALPFLWRRVGLAYLAYPDHHATANPLAKSSQQDPYYNIPAIIAINMIMAAASGGIIAILIATWAQGQGERILAQILGSLIIFGIGLVSSVLLYGALYVIPINPFVGHKNQGEG